MARVIGKAEDHWKAAEGNTWVVAADAPESVRQAAHKVNYVWDTAIRDAVHELAAIIVYHKDDGLTDAAIRDEMGNVFVNALEARIRELNSDE